jgi:hypothetical protein
MNVQITLSEENSLDNKLLLDWLNDHVAEYKQRFKFAPIKTLRGQAKGLPCARIGQKAPVIGRKPIVAALQSTYEDLMRLQGGADGEVNAFLSKAIERGIDEPNPTEGADSQRLAAQFTLESQHREAMKARATGQPVAKVGPTRSPIPGGPTRGERKQQCAGNVPKSAVAAGFDQVDGGMETDPHMRAYWANQLQTPGT